MKKLINKTIALSAIALALSGCNTDELPAKTGNSFGQLSLSGIAKEGETLTATVTDGNGVDASSITYRWLANDTDITSASGSSFMLTSEQAGTQISVVASYVDNDNYQERLTSSQTAVVELLNPPTEFSGLSAGMTNNPSGDLTGVVSVSGAEGLTIVAETAVMTTFGQFSIGEAGEWSYTLDTSNATIASLSDETDSVTDTITITSSDGEMADLVITITGVAIQGPTKAAKITDNMTDDAGELRLKLDSAISQGKLTVSFLKEDKAETADGVAKDAYIGIFGESTSTSNAILDLRIQANQFVIRDQDDIHVNIPFIPDVWTDVEITWDASAASDSVAPLLTVSINGTSVTTQAFSSASASLSDVMSGVRYAIFKLGDNSSTIPNAAYYVDDIKLYSDLAGTTLAFEDDFESYANGVSLDTDNPDSPYNSSSAEVIVETVAGSGDEMVNPDNLAAQITDNMTDDAGEVRLKLDSAIANGKMTLSFLKEANATTADGVAKDAYIGIFGESTSTSNAIMDLRIQESGFVIRDQDGINVTVPFTPDVWTDVEITWDASAATDAIAPLVTVTINGTSVTTEAFSSASASLSDVMTGVRYAIFKLGDNSSTIPNAAFFVDNVKIYSDMAGTSIAFEDDFEGYVEGDSLDTDNAASPYHSNTAEAVVAKKAM